MNLNCENLLKERLGLAYYWSKHRNSKRGQRTTTTSGECVDKPVGIFCGFGGGNVGTCFCKCIQCSVVSPNFRVPVGSVHNCISPWVGYQSTLLCSNAFPQSHHTSAPNDHSLTKHAGQSQFVISEL